MVHHGLEDIRKVIPDLSQSEIENTDFGQYTTEQYLEDLGRWTEYYCDPDLAETLVRQSTDTVSWIHQKGLRFLPLYGSYAIKHGAGYKFYGGVVASAIGGGRGLIEGEMKAARRDGVEIRFGHQVKSLLQGAVGIEGVRVRANGIESEIRSSAVVLACGGFEANREWRSRYLGQGWDMAKVRGTRFNTGDGIRVALDAGAQSYGQWTGCHAVSWERNAPDFGDLNRSRIRFATAIHGDPREWRR